MAEEHKCQAPPEGHRLCANGCGFFGSPATLNLCSKCYRDLRLKEDQASSAKIAVENSFRPFLLSPPPVLPSSQPSSSSISSSTDPIPPPQQPNRCSACRKKVGLMGFRCRCGETFCGTHRYPEHHTCGFDFKSEGREAIARANPLVKADKLDKI